MVPATVDLMCLGPTTVNSFYHLTVFYKIKGMIKMCCLALFTWHMLNADRVVLLSLIVINVMSLIDL